MRIGNNLSQIFKTARKSSLLSKSMNKIISHLKFAILILLMMSRYYPPPKFQGRPVSISRLSKGKRHYWGQKGKSYGFYTSGQEIDMEDISKRHRRIKSQATYHGYEDNPQQFARRATAILQRNSERRESDADHHFRNYTEIGIQAEDLPAESNQIAISKPLSIKQRLQDYVQNRKIEDENLQERSFPQNKVFLPKINQKRAMRQQIDQEYQKKTGRFNQGERLEQSGIDSLNRQPVVYYRKKSRLDNPTFCNSFGYPLSCHRYV